MAQIIGFSNTFYTLWSVSAPYKEYTSAHTFYWKVDKQYLRNLSTDLETAKSKVEGDFTIDLELKGTSFFSDRISSLVDESPLDMFPFGKLKGQVISTSTDVWQLDRLYNTYRSACNGRFLRIGVIARRRLIELGELVKYPHLDVIIGSEKVYEVRYNYTSRKNMDLMISRAELAKGNDHYFTDGEKVTLTLTEVASTNYDSPWGTQFVVTYKDEEGRKFKYVGGSPINFNGEALKVKATVKHSEYNGAPETRLQRIKIIG